MTRETKVGLVVAGSFVVLVGVVIASKMRGGAPPSSSETAQTVRPGSEESERPEKPAPSTDARPDPSPPVLPKTEDPRPEVPRTLPDGLRPVGATETPPKGLPDVPPVAPLPIDPPPTAPKKDILPPLPPFPPTAAITDEEQKKTLDALARAKDPASLPGLPGLPGGTPKEKESTGALLAQAKDGLPTLPPVPPPTPETKKDDLPPIPPPGKLEVPSKVELPPVPPPPGKVDELPPIPPPPGATPKKEEPKKVDLSPPPPVFPGAKKDAGFPPLPPPGKEPAPAVFPMPGKTPEPPAPVSPGFGKDPKKETPPPLPPIDPGPFEKKTAGPAVPPPEPFEKKSPTPPGPVGIGLPEIKDRKDPVPVPPLGAGLKTPSGPGTPSTLPKVTTTDIPPYVLRAEDRDVGAISKKFYGSDRYADALVAFNRAHPLSKEEIRRTPPVLIPGQMLYIPPRELLEKKYASMIVPEGRPVIGATGPEVAPVKIGRIGPPPVGSDPLPTPPRTTGTPVALGTPGGGTPGIGVPAAPTTKLEGGKRFVVAGTPQHIAQIAQQTLGDSRRWPEIYRLNPGLQLPMVPAGTELRLPADARVP